MNIYQTCPTLQNENFLLRPVCENDCEQLLKVYADKNALPFFNSDNCDGDIFFYETLPKMQQALSFWQTAYKNCWFVRLAIVEKSTSCVIGTVELCTRASEDAFNNFGILRVDVASRYETEETLLGVFSLVAPRVRSLLGCDGVITKVPAFAVERKKAVQKVGFEKSNNLLVGKDGTLYGDYWTLR